MVENSDGTYPNTYGNEVKDFRGRNNPPIDSRLTPYDTHLKTAGPTSIAVAVPIRPPVAPTATNNWTFTLPTGLADGQIIVLNLMMTPTRSPAPPTR